MPLTVMPVNEYPLDPNTADADQRLTVDGTTGGVQFSAWEKRTTHVFLTVETAEVRFTLDSSAPTSTNGHVLGVGDVGLWPRSWAVAAKFIRTGGASATIHASPLTMTGS